MKKLLRGNSGFTLMELVITAGIIGLIGTVLVQGIMSAKSSTEVTDVQEYMDVITTEAVEAFKAEPTELVNFVLTSGVPQNSLPHPYDTMRVEPVNPAERTEGVKFVNYYNEYLMDFNSNRTDPQVKYAVEMRLIPDAPSNANPAFKFTVSKWKLNVKVLTKKSDSSNTYDEMYTKDFEFDNIAVKNQSTNPGSTFPPGTVTSIAKFYPNKGTFTEADISGMGSGVVAPDGGMEIEIANATSILSYAPPVTGTDGYAKKVLGWTTVKDDRSTMVKEQDLVDVNQPNVYYAYFLEENVYEIRFELSKSKQAFNSNLSGIINDGTHTSSYRVKDEDLDKPIESLNLKIGDILSADGNNVEKKKALFNNDAVKEPGKKFKAWIYKENVSYTYDKKFTITDSHQLVLQPEMEISRDPVKTINSIDVTLDISNRSDLPDLYGFHDVQYSLEYNEGKDSFDILQIATPSQDACDYGFVKDCRPKEERFTVGSKGVEIYYGNNPNNKKILSTYLSESDKYVEKIDVQSVNLSVKYNKLDLTDFKSKVTNSNYPKITTAKNKKLAVFDLTRIMGDKPKLSYKAGILTNVTKLEKAFANYISDEDYNGSASVTVSSSSSKVKSYDGKSSAPELVKNPGGGTNYDNAYTYIDVNVNNFPILLLKDHGNEGLNIQVKAYYADRLIKGEYQERLILGIYAGWGSSATNAIEGGVYEKDLGPRKREISGKSVDVKIRNVYMFATGTPHSTGSIGTNMVGEGEANANLHLDGYFSLPFSYTMGPYNSITQDQITYGFNYWYNNKKCDPTSISELSWGEEGFGKIYGVITNGPTELFTFKNKSNQSILPDGLTE